MARGVGLWLIALSLWGCATTVTDHCQPVHDPTTVTLDSTDTSRLAEAARDNRKRELLALAYLDIVGCDSLRQQSIAQTAHHNLICAIQGTVHGVNDRRHIVVGAHHDQTGPGAGVADNWSGIVLLAALASHFATNRPDSDFTFIAFGEEEPGMIGASQYVKSMSSGDPVSMMVNIDTVGIRDLVIDRKSSRRLQCIARGIAASMDVEVNTRYLPKTSGDWAPFAKQQIPTLNFHSMQSADLHRIHTSRDRAGLVDAEKLNAAYGVILNTLLELDRGLDMAF